MIGSRKCTQLDGMQPFKYGPGMEINVVQMFLKSMAIFFFDVRSYVSRDSYRIV
jgi:hypothetical protein